MRWTIRHNSALYVGGATILGALLGSRRAQREIERDWRISPYTPVLHPVYASRYRQFRAAEYAALLGASILLICVVAKRSPSLRRRFRL